MRPTSLLRTRLLASRGRAILMLAPTAPLAGQDLLADFEAKTSVHVLENGWTFIIVERPVAPVFSFATVVNVGGAQEVPGITGLAHMFEHMAFKGTPNIGTTDYEAEKKALEEVERRLPRLRGGEAALRAPTRKRSKGSTPHSRRRRRRRASTSSPTSSATSSSVRAASASTPSPTSDHTVYAYSFPANRLELFAFLESERFLHPVFREFYKERDVVQEERRMRTESQPIGRMIEQLVSTAYVAHPYKQPVVGYMSDLQSFTATDAEKFYRKHYVPSNLVTVMVGHVAVGDVLPTIEKYFGRLPGREAGAVAYGRAATDRREDGRADRSFPAGLC